MSTVFGLFSFFSIYNLEFSEVHGWSQTMKLVVHGRLANIQTSTEPCFDTTSMTSPSIKTLPQSICGIFTKNEIKRKLCCILSGKRHFSEFSPIQFVDAVYNDHQNVEMNKVWTQNIAASTKYFLNFLCHASTVYYR